jgi:hypothetical protein
MKFSYRQILASAGGAVLSAVIASIFGVKGTIVGVALGSVAATAGTALALQSMERANKAVKQVVVRAPDNVKLLRRLGGTTAAGVTETAPAAASALTEETATSATPTEGTVEGGDADPTAVQAAGPAATSDAAPSGEPTRPEGIRLPVAVAAVAAVFVFALGFVTVLELIVGRPLADLFGNSGAGTTVEKIFESPSTTLPAPAPTTTSTTTSPTSSTTTTTSPSATTTTTGVGESSTSTTGLGSPTTLPSSSSTTTLPGAPPSTTATNSG